MANMSPPIQKKQNIFVYLWNQVIVPNLIWSAIVTIPSALCFAYSLYRSYKLIMISQPLPMHYLVMILGSGFVCLISLTLYIIYFFHYLHHKKNINIFPSFTTDYRISEAEYELFFRDRQHLTQTQTVTIISQDDSLREIKHTMNWTGQQYIKSVLSPSCRNMTLIDTTRKTAPFSVIIRLDNPLQRGSPVQYSFTTEVKDASCSMIPYLTKFVRCQTEKLTIKVTAPKGMLKNVHRCIYGDPELDIPLDAPVPVQANNAGDYEVFEYTFSELELLRYYAICWSFE